ncbi:unnamed protein product [Ceratitis capitata]|uniref:(Mediterranean fruit fly) hypothetical protein n=1 Tax=Ceratitis capitata TaxID=7213 RepID=A0A811VGF6_CERCA|nr:unnamed protein product [Ceratitis capitata]
MLVVVIAVTLKLLWTNNQLLLLPFEVVAIVIVVIATVIASTAADNGLKSITNCGHCYVYRLFALHNTHSHTHTNTIFVILLHGNVVAELLGLLSHLFIVVDFVIVIVSVVVVAGVTFITEEVPLNCYSINFIMIWR